MTSSVTDALTLANVGTLYRARALSSNTSRLATALTPRARIASACHLPTSFRLAVQPRSPRPPKNQSFQGYSVVDLDARVSTWLVRDARRNWSNHGVQRCAYARSVRAHQPCPATMVHSERRQVQITTESCSSFVSVSERASLFFLSPIQARLVALASNPFRPRGTKNLSTKKREIFGA